MSPRAHSAPQWRITGPHKWPVSYSDLIISWPSLLLQPTHCLPWPCIQSQPYLMQNPSLECAFFNTSLIGASCANTLPLSYSHWHCSQAKAGRPGRGWLLGFTSFPAYLSWSLQWNSHPFFSSFPSPLFCHGLARPVLKIEELGLLELMRVRKLGKAVHLRGLLNLTERKQKVILEVTFS